MRVRRRDPHTLFNALAHHEQYFIFFTQFPLEVHAHRKAAQMKHRQRPGPPSPGQHSPTKGGGQSGRAAPALLIATTLCNGTFLVSRHTSVTREGREGQRYVQGKAVLGSVGLPSGAVPLRSAEKGQNYS